LKRSFISSIESIVLFQDTFGQKLDLYIGDPKFPTNNGRHHTLKFKVPRKTRKVYIQSDPLIAPSTVSTTFTLLCELETKKNIIKDGDWTFINCSTNKPNIERIPFEEGTRHPFFDKDNLKEPRWKKYVLPTIQAFVPVAAAAITGGASMAAAVMGTPTTIQTTAGVAITGGASIAGAVITGGATMAAAKLGTSNAQTMNFGTGNVHVTGTI
jgi:hypothetical protein